MDTAYPLGSAVSDNVTVDELIADLERAKTNIEFRNRILTEYAPFVHTIATKIDNAINNRVPIGDLVSNGYLGLIDAIGRYDPSQGAKFETYASLRIRGAIIDGLRECDWVSRTTRRKLKKIQRAEIELGNGTGQSISIDDLAEATELTPEEIETVKAQKNSI